MVLIATGALRKTFKPGDVLGLIGHIFKKEFFELAGDVINLWKEMAIDNQNGLWTEIN
jgi:hypothetical protein